MGIWGTGGGGGREALSLLCRKKREPRSDFSTEFLIAPVNEVTERTLATQCRETWTRLELRGIDVKAA